MLSAQGGYVAPVVCVEYLISANNHLNCVDSGYVDAMYKACTCNSLLKAHCPGQLHWTAAMPVVQDVVIMLLASPCSYSDTAWCARYAGWTWLYRVLVRC